MRNSRAVWTIPAAVVLLVACADNPTAPKSITDVAPAFGDCSGVLMTKAASTAAAAPSLTIGTLPTVTVTATYSGARTGLPFNLVQAMNYPSGGGIPWGDCGGGDPDGLTITAAEPEDTLPPPPEVDTGWWSTLSPRERAVLLKFAQIYMQLRPDLYTTPGRVIAGEFQERVSTLKVRAKARTMDYYQLDQTAKELLYGGIYACRLYQNFLFDEVSPLMPDQVGELASSLASAFGATLHYKAPLRGITFGRNAVAGIALAHRNPHGDCGTMVFQAAGHEIVVADPYGGSVPSVPELER